MITKYILFVQCVFISYITFTTSVKTYQVRKINESSYLVTSLPDIDYESFYRRIFDGKDRRDKVISLNDGARTSTEEYPDTTVNVGDKKDIHKPKHKVSLAVINKARDNYFKNFYATMKKPICTHYDTSMPQKIHPYSNATLSMDENKISNLNHNLQTARKLASVLINEIPISMKPSQKLIDNRNRRRRFVKKRKYKHSRGKYSNYY